MSRSASPAPSTPRRGLSRTPSNSSFYSDDQSVGSAYNFVPNRRIEIMVKKEQQRQKDEAQFTYQPIIFTQRSPSSQRLRREQQIEGDQENRFDKLYGDAVKRQITEKIIQQVANDVAFDRDLTFSPRLSKKGANLSRSASRERLGISRSSFSSEAGSIASTARTSRSRSSSPARSEYSFSPQITKKAQLSADRRSLSAEHFFSDEPSASRLYRQAAVFEEKAAQRKEEMEQLSMQECTFTPRLATNRAAVTLKVHEELQHGNGLDVSERLMRREHLRKIKLEQAKLDQDAKQREQLTFKPQIKGMKSRSASPARPADVVERLLTPTRKSRNAIIAEAEANVQLTFHPKIPSRRSASPNTVREQVYSSVHEKLFVEGVHHQREKDTESERQRAELPAEYTFRPRLRSRSGTPTSSSSSPFDGHDDHGSVGSSSTAVVDTTALFARLAYQDKANPVRRQKLEDEVARRMPFKPTIGEKSRELQAQRNCSTPIYQRLKDKADKCAAELAARRALVAQQRAEEDARNMRPPQLSIRSLELVALHRRSQSASPSPQRRISSSSKSTPRSPGINVGDEEKDGNDAAYGVDVCDEAEEVEEEEDTTSSVFSRLSEQHTSSSARRRSLAAREHLLGRDDPQSFRLSMDDDDDAVDGDGDGDGVDHHNHFVRASAKRTLSGRDLHHMVQRLAVPYPREQRQQRRPAEDASATEPLEHRTRPRLPAAVLDAAATRLNQKTTQAFRLATDERLRQEAQDKAMSENDVYARFTPRKMTEAQRGALFQRLAAGERRSDDVHYDDVHDDNDDDDVRRVIPSSSSSYGVHRRNAPSPSPSPSGRHSSSGGSSSGSAQVPATSKTTRSSSTPPSTSRRKTPFNRRGEEDDDNGSDARSVSTVGSVHSVKSNASFRSWQSHSSASKAKPTTTTPTRITTTSARTTSTTTTSSTLQSTSSSTPTATTPRASSSIRAGAKTVGSAVVTNNSNSNSNNNSRSTMPTQQRGMSPRASNGNGIGNGNSHNSSNNRSLSSLTPKVIISRSTINGGGRSASSSSSMQPVDVDDAASEAVLVASSPKVAAAAVSNSINSYVTETDTAPPESTELLIVPTESSMTTTAASAEAIVRSPPSVIQSPMKAAGGGNGLFPSHGSAAQNVHHSPTPSTSTSSSSRPSFSSSSAADRLVYVHVPPSPPALGGRKPSNSRIPMPSSAALPSHAPKVQYEWAGSKQNTSKKPSDDFEAKLQASLAMLKPLDDLLASPIIGHSSTTKHMAPDK